MVGSFQTFWLTLPFPLERVVEGLVVIILREGVGEDRVPNRDKGAEVSSIPSSSLRFFNLGVSWDKGSFFKLFTWAYLSLLYLVAISAKQKVKGQALIKKREIKEEKVS